MQAEIVVISSGNTLIVPGTPGQSIRVRSVSLSGTAATAFYFTSYNGSSYTQISGTYQDASAFGIDFQGFLRTGAGNGLGINISGADTIGGTVTYDAVPLAA